MNEIQIIPILVQAGAVGISFALIGLVYWIVKVIIGNHITHSNEIQREMTKAMERLASVIEALDKRLNSKKHR